MEIVMTYCREDGLDCIRYSALEDGKEIGFLLAHTTGLILNVEVNEVRQREGIASALFEYGDEEQGLYHIPAWGRTDDGDAFARAVGGDTMDDGMAASIVGMDLSIY